MAEHTPLPWSICETVNKGEIGIASDGDPLVIAVKSGALLHPKGKANAAFIVEACNSYYDLTARCEKLREALEALLIQAIQSSVSNPENEWGREALEQARAALSEGDG